MTKADALLAKPQLIPAASSSAPVIGVDQGI